MVFVRRRERPARRSKPSLWPPARLVKERRTYRTGSFSERQYRTPDKKWSSELRPLSRGVDG